MTWGGEPEGAAVRVVGAGGQTGGEHVRSWDTGHSFESLINGRIVRHIRFPSWYLRHSFYHSDCIGHTWIILWIISSDNIARILLKIHLFNRFHSWVSPLSVSLVRMLECEHVERSPAYMELPYVLYWLVTMVEASTELTVVTINTSDTLLLVVLMSKPGQTVCWHDYHQPHL